MDRIQKLDSLTPSALSSYLKTRDALWYWITLFLSTITTVIILVFPDGFYPWIYLRYGLGAIFLLYLPGYAVIKTIYPVDIPIKTSSINLDRIERFGLSFSMSIALTPLVGLLLNYTSWGVRLIPITSILFVLTISFATIAVMREYQIKLKNE